MRRFFTLKAALLLTYCGMAPAAAQMYPGQDVTVNPSASGSQVLLYPGGQYRRVVHPLLQPGERDPYAPIQLHMPRHHVARHIARKPVSVAAAALQPEAAPLPAPAAESPLPDDSASRLVLAESPSHKSAPVTKPRPVKASRPAPQPMRQPADSDFAVTTGEAAPEKTKPAPTRLASTAPAPVTAPQTGGLTKQHEILFAAGSSDPNPAMLDAVKALAGTLNAAGLPGKIELQAYGGTPGDKSSDARRLSLKRALIVRQMLIDGGVSSERIDVHAMGGADDGGAPDRVDVMVRG
jgi:outer membrane protein OmpA-like peptidoglycan-associated protein